MPTRYSIAVQMGVISLVVLCSISSTNGVLKNLFYHWETSVNARLKLPHQPEKIIVAIACGVHSANQRNLSALPLVDILLATFPHTAESAYLYRFYFAYDLVDSVFSNRKHQRDVGIFFSSAIAAENRRRELGSHLDRQAINIETHWVPCNYTGKPAWAQNDAACQAFSDGADYIFRTNDDTEFPQRHGWLSALIQELRSRRPVPNLGVVGPDCQQGNTNILTHDFTHRTHIQIHQFHYPRSLPNWFADDWITRVYDGFNPPLMVRHKDVQVIHKIAPQRYSVPQPNEYQQLLQLEIDKGKAAIKKYLEHFVSGSAVSFPHASQCSIPIL